MALRYEIPEVVLSPRGPAISAATATIKDLSGNNLTVYAAETGSTTASNPITTDANGRIEGWVEAPDYDIVIGGVAAAYTQKIRLSPVGHFHVNSYGAKGDDSTDNTTAISATFDAAIAAGGGTVTGASGKVYRFSSILKNPADNIRVWAPGVTFRSTLGKTSATIVLQLIGENIKVEDITIDHVTPVVVDTDAASRAVTCTIRIGVNNPGVPGDFHIGALVRGCTIKSSRNTPISVQGFSKVKVLDNTLTTALGNGVLISNCPFDTQVRGNHIEDTGDDGIAFLSDPGLTALNQRVVVTGNSVYKTYANGIDFSGVEDGVIDNNVIEKTWANGIFVSHDVADSLGTVRSVVIGDQNVIRDAGQYYGASQYKTTVNASAYGIKFAADIDGIVVGYPKIINPSSGAYNFGQTGELRRGQPMAQRAAPGGYVRTSGVSLSSAIPAEAQATAVPVWVSTMLTANSLNVKVTVAGSAAPNALVRLGLYGDSGEFYPLNRLADGGTVDCTTTGLKTATISQAVGPGLYWLVAVCQNVAATRPTLNILSGQAYPLPANSDPAVNINAFTASSVTGALPATFTISGQTSTGTALTLGFA